MEVENVRKKLRSLKKRFEKFDGLDDKRARKRLEDISKKAVDDAMNRFIKVSQKRESQSKYSCSVVN